MFRNTSTHTFFNEGKIASKSGAVVLFNTPKENYKVRRFIGAVLLAVSLGMVTTQANWVYNAKADEAPVTSPATSEESSSQESSSPATSPETNSPSSPSNNGGGNSGGGSSSGSSVGTPSCDNQKPNSAPKIISATTTATNEITLNWEKAQNPVTHYVIIYGLESGKPIYGNPNVGNVTSYPVKQLSGGTTYYFQVRAGNDCMPGAYSEEIAVKVGGKFIKDPAQNFQPGVLGKSIRTIPKSSPKPAASFMPKVQINVGNGGLIGKIFNFFSNFFKP